MYIVPLYTKLLLSSHTHRISRMEYSFCFQLKQHFWCRFGLGLRVVTSFFPLYPFHFLIILFLFLYTYNITYYIYVAGCCSLRVRNLLRSMISFVYLAHVLPSSLFPPLSFCIYILLLMYHVCNKLSTNILVTLPVRRYLIKL